MASLSRRTPGFSSAVPALVLVLLFASHAAAQPSLVRIEPGALVPGQTTEVTLHGAKLDEPLRVWSSFPAEWEVVPPEGEVKGGRTSVKVKCTLPADAQCGIGGIAVAAAEGPSDILLVPIDNLPSIAEGGTTNRDLASAQEIAIPAGVDGKSDGAAFDYYKFNGKAGQGLSIEVLGARLRSDFDPVLRLLDANGRQLALADDDLSCGADCRLRYTLPADGDYFIELRDNRYKDNGRYRLRIGDFPLVSTSFPLSATVGQPATPGFTGPYVAGVAPAAITPSTTGQVPLTAAMPGGEGAGLASLLVDDLPVVVETSDTEKANEPTPTELPCAINGRIEVPGDRDEFRFTATKDTRIRLDALTRSLGSPAIVQLRLLDAAGKQLAETPINDNDEEGFSFVIPADGEYRVAVEELVGLGGDDYTYRIAARVGPMFTLRLKKVANQVGTMRFAVSPGSMGDFQVECVRFGYDGPIELSIDSPRSGWQTHNATIPAKGKEVQLFVTAPADLQPGEFLPLRIVGRADVGGREHTAVMETDAHLRAAYPQQPYPPLWLNEQLTAAAIAPKPEFYKVAGDKSELFFPRLIGQTQLTLNFERTVEAFKNQPLTIVPLEVPPGMSLEVKRNGNGPKETYDLILKGAKDLAEGKHTLKYLAYAEHAGIGWGTVAEVPVSVVTPLAVSLAPTEPIVQGQTQKIKIALNRQGDDKQPVEIKFKKLPAGVMAPEAIKLEADQNELEIELVATADAAIGKVDDIAVTATTRYAGQDLNVDSPNVSLEVKAP